jgi:hypothetical protein
VQDIESDEGSFQEELDENAPDVLYEDLKFFKKVDFKT